MKSPSTSYAAPRSQRRRHRPGESALIIGGGDVAMDVAGALKSWAVESVTCVAREELAEFPASVKEFTTTQAFRGVDY
ncbi:NAD-binding protein [Shigella flexneri]